ncbi:MAG: hypothetical protein PUA75_12475 [Clostridiales bacterium]|nr:hypothetical protein [Clostridiales bacterium]
MSQEYSSTNLPEPQEKNLMPLVSILGIVILFIADLYVIINNSDNFIVLAAITILMLIWIFLLVNSILKQSRMQKRKEAEKIEELFRGQKANYLQQKKAAEQIAGVRDVLKESSSTEDVITAQKALAKVTISRSRENAEALMNSNDKMMEKMKELVQSVESGNGEVLSQQKAIIDDYIKEIMEKEQEILSGLQEMEASIRSEFSQTVDKMNELANEAVTSAVEKAVAEIKQSITVPVTETSFSEEMPTMEEKAPLEEMPIIEEEVPLEEMPIIEEEVPLEEMPIMEEEVPLEEMPIMEENPIEEEVTMMEQDSSILEEFPIMEESSVPEEMSAAEEEARLDSILADVQGLGSEINIPNLLPEEEEEPSIEEDSLSIDSILSNIPSLGEEDMETESGSIALDDLPSLDSILSDIPSLGDEDAIAENEVTDSEGPALDESGIETLALEDNIADTLGAEEEHIDELPSLDSILADMPGLGEELSIEDLPVLDDIPIVEDGEAPTNQAVPNIEAITSEPLVEEEESVIEPEPVVEEEAVIEPEPVAEEAAAEPEKEPAVSNKIMTPDEIAALIANL